MVRAVVVVAVAFLGIAAAAAAQADVCMTATMSPTKRKTLTERLACFKMSTRSRMKYTRSKKRRVVTTTLSIATLRFHVTLVQQRAS